MMSTTRIALLVPLVLATFVGCGEGLPERADTPIRINEVNSDNGVFQDMTGDTDDWIELYNQSDEDFQLDGFYVSDSPNRRFKDRFVAGTVIAAHGVLLLWADGQVAQSSARAPHLSFKLADRGEGVWLSTPEGYVADKVEFARMPVDPSGSAWTSFQRFPDGTGAFVWCSTSTPEVLNGDACAGDLL